MLYSPVGPNTLEGSLAWQVATLLTEMPTLETSAQISPSRVRNNINLAYEWMNQMAVDRAYARLLTYEDATVTDFTTGLLNVAWNQWKGQVVSFKCLVNGAQTNPAQFFNELQAVRADAVRNYVNGVWGYGIAEFNGQLRIQNPCGQANWRIWYLRKPQNLVYGDCPSTGTTTTLVLEGTPVNEDDFYRNETFMTTGSAGTQLGYCTAYDFATKVATCRKIGGGTAVPFPTAPVAGDTYSNVVWFDAEFQRLLVMKAARLFSTLPNATDFDREIEEWTKRYVQWLERDDLTSVTGAVDNGRFGVGLGAGVNVGRPGYAFP